MKKSDWDILAGYGVTPDNLRVGGGLFLNDTAITSLPDNLSVGGGLFLNDTAITSLPDNLSVGRGLYLRGTAITSLPDNLSVGRGLYLRGTAITSLPDNLSVGGGLDLSGTAITPTITDLRGFDLFHIQRKNGVEWFIAGCRFFKTRADALAHWGGDDYPDKERGAQFVAAIEAAQWGAM